MKKKTNSSIVLDLVTYWWGDSSYCSVVAGKSLYNYIVITLITLGASLVALLALSLPGKIWGYTRRRVVGAMRAVTPRCSDHPVCVCADGLKGGC